MLTIRCTRKLLKRLRAEPPRDPTLPTNRLGDWYANLVPTKRGTLVICVSERSLLPVFVAANADARSFTLAFQDAVRSVLRAIGAAESVESEAGETKEIAIGTTASRRVLGSLNDLASLARFTVAEHPSIDLATLAVKLADTPCLPLSYQSRAHRGPLALAAQFYGLLARGRPPAMPQHLRLDWPRPSFTPR